MHTLPEGEYLGMVRGLLGSKRGEESSQLVCMREFRYILADNMNFSPKKMPLLSEQLLLNGPQTGRKGLLPFLGHW